MTERDLARDAALGTKVWREPTSPTRGEAAKNVWFRAEFFSFLPALERRGLMKNSREVS